MTQVNRKSSSMHPEDRRLRREEIMDKRVGMRRQHMQSGRYYVQYRTTTFHKRQSDRANARYAALPDGAMHNLPLGHIVRSNDWKRDQVTANHTIKMSAQTPVGTAFLEIEEPTKKARKPRAKKAD